MPMRTSVAAAWPKFISRWEGRTSYMYLDTLKFVTFGVGRKIDDNNKISTHGLTRPWRKKTDGSLVTEAAIQAEWSKVKARTDLASKGGYAFKDVGDLTLRDPDIDESLMDTTGDFWDVLVKTLPKLPQWPADAQLAILNMAYHMGPAFLGSKWPNFTAAAKATDFAKMATNCSTANKTPRDACNVKLYVNAGKVTYAALNADTLYQDAPVTVTAWPKPGPALAVLDASQVAGAKASVFCDDAWYAQRMLVITKDYSGPVDGLWGNQSKASFAAWAKRVKQPNQVTVTTLTALSKSTFLMPVVS